MTAVLGEAERHRLHATFETLCRIESPTGHERACADWITHELVGLGLEVSEDGAGREAGADAGNLLVRIPGRGPRSIMLCAHMDTVPLTAPVEPVAREGGWENAGDGILGADNKSAVAALIETARWFVSAPQPPEVGLELVFTVCEENGLNGAKAFDASRLRSELGYVFDHASPYGEIVAAAPTYLRITADVHGRAAHAGIRPEAGANAIVAAARAIAQLPQGRLDGETTVNVGTIAGGTATNVVAERCRVEIEVRAVDAARAEALATEIIDRLQDGVDAAACDLDVIVEKLFTGFRMRSTDPAIELARRALQAIGYAPRLITTGGGSDANAFLVSGFPCVNLANGTERNHEPTERVSFAALEAGLELAISVLTEAERFGEPPVTA